MRNLWITLLVTALSAAVNISAATYDRSKEVAQYTRLIQSSSDSVRLNALSELSWVGLSDEQLFAEVSRQLQQVVDAGFPSEQEQEAVLLMKALSGSGLMMYEPTLQSVSDVIEKKRKALYAAAQQALTALPKSVELNLIKSDDQYVSAQTPFSVAIFLNFIHADDLAMKRRAADVLAAERLANQQVLKGLQAEIEKHYQDENTNEEWAQTYLLLCQALVYVGGSGYGPLIHKVAQGASNDKLRSGAKELLRKYQLHQKKRL